jgi:hypothetical protein
MRVFGAFPTIVEGFVGSIYSNDEKQRTRALIWLTIPNGLVQAAR